MPRDTDASSESPALAERPTPVSSGPWHWEDLRQVFWVVGFPVGRPFGAGRMQGRVKLGEGKANADWTQEEGRDGGKTCC